MTKKQRELGRHALGLPNKERESYRNHFVAGPAHDDYAEWMLMVSEGNAVRLERADIYGGDFCFYLTRVGAEGCLQGKEQLDPDDFRLRVRELII
jgi:hypothetical protein